MQRRSYTRVILATFFSMLTFSGMTEPAFYYRPDDGGFRIRFPYIPRYKPSVLPPGTPPAGSIWVHLAAENRSYAIAHLDIPEENRKPTAKILADTVKVIGDMLRGTMTDVRFHDLDGYPAVSFRHNLEILGQPMASRHVVAMRKRRLIMAHVEGPPEIATEPDTELFFTSLTLDPLSANESD